ncbi:hypothetical protein GCM10010425_15860 [Streptomyces spororaveus]|uniref:Uncharacterized protein n=1 Tax=Streptomyces spororaveus TaxID=284039 RepID=A0ABQ3T9G2_9ACTN|nr:DUF6087 family protein [Streptomyces spororaveus]GHI77046.1 hypothetical protein Sspor_26070 [Streptomyces spororaveus]
MEGEGASVLRPAVAMEAVALGAGRRRAAHVDPDAPRPILEGDGYAWQPVTAVENHAAALRFLHPPLPAPPSRPVPPGGPTAPGTGRHRRT